MNFSLKETRFSRVRGELGNGALISGKGQLKAEISAGLQEPEDPNQSVAQVAIKISGLPQDAKNEDQFAFQVEVVGNGLYEWPSGKRPADLKDMELTRLLCQPIYTLAVSETIQLAQRLGFNNVKLPWDMPTKSDAPPPAKKPRTRKQAAKPVAVKRAKAK
ncbi:MAG: hypothetical protein Q8K23_20495 [Sulfuritalea sp.]|nr:hypothetical protein [Sulfuritalea sp.]